MPVLSWLRPPRDLLMLFLLVMLAPAATLVVLGLRLVEQDRALERQRLTEQRESAADRAAMSLEQALTATETALANPKIWNSEEDALRLVFSSNGIEVAPHNGLLYYPSLPERREAPARLFQQAEEDEFGRQDYQAAIVHCRGLLSSTDPAVRAGALLRLARNQRKAGHQQATLDAYRQLVRMQPVTLGGVPVDLLARRARCSILAELRRSEELREEAAALHADLHACRWQLDRASFYYFFRQAHSLIGAREDPQPEQVALANAVEILWTRWKQSPWDESNLKGRQCLSSAGIALTALWQSSPEGMVVLVAGPRYGSRHLFAALSGIPGFKISLLNLEGRTIFGEAFAVTSSRALRRASETGLPWNLVVADSDPQHTLDEFASRRRLLLPGLGLLLILVTAGSYFIWRAMARELAAARLQSDFVAAVSHEFRTPLTSLRQFNTLLAEGETADEQRREFWGAQARATDRLQRLVESLLDFGRMEAGARPYQFEAVDLGALVEETVREFQGEPNAAGFAFQCSVTHVRAKTDAEAISRALWNLLDNAVKYSGESRSIAVKVGSDADFVSVAVHDHGPGVPRAEQKTVFDKFVRGAYAREHHIRGTGIGLTMVRHIVEAHGGKITLTSAPGEGSTFTIQLPARG